jgi:hypothetical protein
MRKTILYCILFINACFIAVSCKELSSSEANKLSVVDVAATVTEFKEKVNAPFATYRDLFSQIEQQKSILEQKKIIGDFEFSMNYQPHVLLTLINNDSLNPDAPLNKNLLKKTEEYTNLHYIKFSIENKTFKSELLRYEVASAEDYSNRVNYYAFHIKQDVMLIQNDKDTIRNAFVTMERTFDISPKLNLVFAFETKANAKIDKLTFAYEDVVFNNGKLNFEINYKAIAHLNSPDFKKIIL